MKNGVAKIEEIVDPKKTFRPRARLLQLLGDQLIRDPRIGVFELVKNAYDADSPTVEVTFENVEDPETTSIKIRDEGEGMDLDTVTDIWLEPGADNREKERTACKRTPRFHRLPIGEKGVGRFASHKLGNHITMVTRRAGFDEVVVDIDWDKLSRYRYLSEAPISIETRVPRIFKGAGHGTNITITDLRHEWKKGDIRRLFRSVNAISSPYDKKTGFFVMFKLNPDPGWLEDLISAENVEEQAMFIFKFTMEKSHFDYQYEFRPIRALAKKKDIEPRKENKKDQIIEYFQMGLDEETGKRKKRKTTADLSQLGIGPIRGRVLGFDRDRDVLALYVTDATGLTQYLNENGGVRVYRDGIRVYNYGERETDWLGLDERRIQIPTRRISNNLILGEIHLDLEKSPGLVEKTNREGFVENEAYKEFRDAVLSAIIRFEQEREKDKLKIRQAFEEEQTKDKKLPLITGPEEAITALKEKVHEAGFDKQLGEYVSKVETTYIEMRDSLLGAVGSGLGLAIVFHEIERGVRDLKKAVDKGDKIERIQVMARHLTELLQGASYLIRTTSKKSLKASDLVKFALFSMSPRFDYHNIVVTNSFETNPDGDFKLKGSQRMLTASLVNLIDNSIYWLNAFKCPQSDKQAIIKRIWIGPSRDLEGPAIVVADNGPGFEDAPDEVVRPFFTRKSEGMGLGLYFANMTMKAHGGRLSIADYREVSVPKAYDGAIVAMVFEE
jgi:anti-sigma regulatory factor (Ser/Thr protein kinase)